MTHNLQKRSIVLENLFEYSVPLGPSSPILGSVMKSTKCKHNESKMLDKCKKH